MARPAETQTLEEDGGEQSQVMITQVDALLSPTSSLRTLCISRSSICSEFTSFCVEDSGVEMDPFPERLLCPRSASFKVTLA